MSQVWHGRREWPYIFCCKLKLPTQHSEIRKMKRFKSCCSWHLCNSDTVLFSNSYRGALQCSTQHGKTQYFGKVKKWRACTQHVAQKSCMITNSHKWFQARQQTVDNEQVHKMFINASELPSQWLELSHSASTLSSLQRCELSTQVRAQKLSFTSYLQVTWDHHMRHKKFSHGTQWHCVRQWWLGMHIPVALQMWLFCFILHCSLMEH